MSGAVDVLTDLRAVIPSHCGCGHPRCGRNSDRADAIKAIAAMSELVAAADAVSSTILECYGNATRMHLAVAGRGGLNERLCAALAAVGGAK